MEYSNPLYSYTVKVGFEGEGNTLRSVYTARVINAHTGEAFYSITSSRRSVANQAAIGWINDASKNLPIRFRLVRQVVTGSPDGIGGTFFRVEYIADIAGDWVEKDYLNGSKSFRMAADCNPRAVAKLRERKLIAA